MSVYYLFYICVKFLFSLINKETKEKFHINSSKSINLESIDKWSISVYVGSVSSDKRRYGDGRYITFMNRDTIVSG